MSNSEETIDTSEKPVEVQKEAEPITKKDPRKVEQGKRLAMISKAAKERKMREKIEAEMSERNVSNYILNYIPLDPKLAIGGSLLVGSFLFYRWFSSSIENKEEKDIKKKKVVKNDVVKDEVVKERIVKISPPTQKKFESFG